MHFSYKYLIYKIYSWTANKKGDTPITNTLLTLGVMHAIQLEIILLFIDRVIIPLNGLWDVNKNYIFVGALLYFILLYFVLYNKHRWDSYVKEFGDENDNDRKKGNILVISF